MDYVVFGVGMGASLVLLGLAGRTIGPSLRFRSSDREGGVLKADELVAKVAWERFCSALGAALVLCGLLLLAVTGVVMLVRPSDSVATTAVLATFIVVIALMLLWTWAYVNRFGFQRLTRDRRAPIAPRELGEAPADWTPRAATTSAAPTGATTLGPPVPPPAEPAVPVVEPPPEPSPAITTPTPSPGPVTPPQLMYSATVPPPIIRRTPVAETTSASLSADADTTPTSTLQVSPSRPTKETSAEEAVASLDTSNAPPRRSLLRRLLPGRRVPSEQSPPTAPATEEAKRPSRLAATTSPTSLSSPRSAAPVTPDQTRVSSTPNASRSEIVNPSDAAALDRILNEPATATPAADILDPEPPDVPATLEPTTPTGASAGDDAPSESSASDSPTSSSSSDSGSSNSDT